MSVRQAVNRNPVIAVVAVVVVVAVVTWSIYHSSRRGPATRMTAYYSSDDGQTWFGAETKEAPPITHDGKPAVRVYLYTCPDGKEFVGYLERYTDQAKVALDQFTAAKEAMKAGGPKPNINIGAVQAAAMGGRQVKKPGDKEWISGSGPAGTAIRNVTCPNGQAAESAE